MGGGSGSKEQRKAEKEQRKLSEQQLALERERLQLEEQAFNSQQQELALLQNQLGVQNRAFTAQVSLLSQQQQEAQQRQQQFSSLLSDLTSAQTRQEAVSVLERERESTRLSEAQKRAREQVEPLPSLLGSRSRKRGSDINTPLTLTQSEQLARGGNNALVQQATSGRGRTRSLLTGA